jgi:hypothetical protein
MELKIYFNPLDKACKSIIGGIKTGETLTFQVFLVKNGTTAVDANAYDSEILQKPPESACEKPQNAAFLQINRDGEALESLERRVRRLEEAVFKAPEGVKKKVEAEVVVTKDSLRKVRDAIMNLFR